MTTQPTCARCGRVTLNAPLPTDAPRYAGRYLCGPRGDACVLILSSVLPPSLSTEWEIASMVLREVRLDLASIGNSPHHAKEHRLTRIAVERAKDRAIRARTAMIEAGLVGSRTVLCRDGWHEGDETGKGCTGYASSDLCACACPCHRLAGILA